MQCCLPAFLSQNVILVYTVEALWSQNKARTVSNLCWNGAFLKILAHFVNKSTCRKETVGSDRGLFTLRLSLRLKMAKENLTELNKDVRISLVNIHINMCFLRLLCLLPFYKILIIYKKIILIQMRLTVRAISKNSLLQLRLTSS